MIAPSAGRASTRAATLLVVLGSPLALPAQQGPYAELTQAREMLAQNRVAAAERLLATLVQDVPGSASAWYELGLCRRLLGKERDALAAAEQALTLEPRFAEAMLLSAELQLRERRQQARERALELAKLVATDPIGERTDFVRRTANVLLEVDEVVAAQKLIDKAAAKAPKDKELLHLSAKLALTLNQPERAAAALRAVLAVDPQDAHAAESLARVLLAMNRRGEAMEALQTSLRRHPSNVHARSLLLQLLKEGNADPERIEQEQAYLRYYQGLRARRGGGAADTTRAGDTGAAPGGAAPGAARRPAPDPRRR